MRKVLKYRAVRGEVQSHGQAGSGTDGARVGTTGLRRRMVSFPVRAASRHSPPLPGKASP